MRNEIVMNMENMNIPPKPYKCNVRRPVLSINGMDTNVITTCTSKICMRRNGYYQNCNTATA